jgi:hypothetical protein
MVSNEVTRYVIIANEVQKHTGVIEFNYIREVEVFISRTAYEELSDTHLTYEAAELYLIESLSGQILDLKKSIYEAQVNCEKLTQKLVLAVSQSEANITEVGRLGK